MIALAFLWCYWPTLSTLANRWSNEPQYSHGFLVPLFALAVLWMRRPSPLPALETCRWGLLAMGWAAVLRLVAATMDVQAIDAASLLLMLAGTVLLLGGWPMFKWAWPSLAFLGFMLPLPFAIEVLLSHPLQRLATVCSVYLLQTFGYPALAEGNIIALGALRLGVVEACSGLGMLMTFFALSTAMALMMRGPLSDRLFIVVSAVPIAVIANVARITATSMAYYHLGEDSTTAHAIMHDLAGWLMMPLALGLLWLELKYLGWLLLPVGNQDPVLALPPEAARS